MTEPTDNELDAVLCHHWPAFSMQATLVRMWVRKSMRDAIAKWRTPPAVAREPFCYVSTNKQGDITRTMKRKDRWTNIPLYTDPRAQAGDVVVTTDHKGQCVAVTRQDAEGKILSVIWQAPEVKAGAMPKTQPTPDVQSKIDNNTWDHFGDLLPTLKAISQGDWYWAANSRCKYIEIRIDTRDGGCILYDRDRVRISPEQLAHQSHKAPRMDPWPGGSKAALDGLAPQPVREPLTDEELLAIWAGDDERFLRPVLGKNKVIDFARAVLAKSGQPSGVGEPVAELFVDRFETKLTLLPNGNDVRPYGVHKLYAPQPTQTQDDALIRQMHDAMSNLTTLCLSGGSPLFTAEFDRLIEATTAARARLGEQV